MQKAMEDVAYALRIPQRKPWGSMAADVAAALAALEDRPRLLAGVPAAALPEGEQQLDDVYKLCVPAPAPRRAAPRRACPLDRSIARSSPRPLSVHAIPPKHSKFKTKSIQIYSKIKRRLKQLELGVKTQQPDSVSIRVAKVLAALAQLEVLQARAAPRRAAPRC